MRPSGLGIPADLESRTKMSRDRKFRYLLTRRWGYGPHATFVLLNPPSTPVNEDDATIRKCTSMARRWKLAGLVIVNLYALRSMTVENLEVADDPVGPENDRYLRIHILAAARHQMPLVFGWGPSAAPERAAWVRTFAGADWAMAFGVADGQPIHPLWVSDRARPTPLRVLEAPRRVNSARNWGAN